MLNVSGTLSDQTRSHQSGHNDLEDPEVLKYVEFKFG